MAKRNLNLDTKEIAVIVEALEIYRNEKMGKADTSLVSLMKKLKNNMKTITVASRKGKGRKLQQFICQEISELIGMYYDQGDDQCLIHSREMGISGTDVVLRGNALVEFPFSIECKSSESFSFMSTIEQAKQNTVQGTDWLIVYKKKGMDNPVAILDWKVFIRLLKERSR